VAALRELRRRIPNICFQMLLRARNAVGYASYPITSSKNSWREAYAQGIDIFASLIRSTPLKNMRVAIDAALETGAVCEASICYTGDILDKGRPKYSLKYYVGMAKQLKNSARIFWPSKIWPACASRTPLSTRSRASRGNRHPHSLPHARHQRPERGFRAEGRRCGRGRRDARHRLHER